MNNFEKAFDKIIITEGGYSDHPSDHGGKTKYGITILTLGSFLGRAATEQDVREITPDTARKIYKRLYWDYLSLDAVTYAPLAIALFDQAVNRGTGRVAREVQQLLGVKADGIVGSITLQALNSSDGYRLLVKFIKLSQEKYTAIVDRDPSQIVFYKGWIKRTHRLLEDLS